MTAAVAVDGCADLAREPRQAHPAADGVRAPLFAVTRTYTAFARRRPALYDAMFTRLVDLPFAAPQTPAPLRDAFGELLAAVAPVTTEEDAGPLTETFWAALHGLTTLMRGGRLPEWAHDRRLGLLVDRFAGKQPGSGGGEGLGGRLAAARRRRWRPARTRDGHLSPGQGAARG
ncbi:TetR-like C-terminal domain-containing protein [Streptomyces malaysiense]|uniref:TetR-like C-terminal domain-containing protein n=1 Tax=Streptomyces malaysiense TaxID=1428626 RepID=UPI0030B845EB